MLHPDRWQRCKQIFQAALQLPRTERGAYVREACGDDKELHRDVTFLLESELQTADYLSEAPPDMVHRSCFHGGEMVAARYRIVRLIGRGGMGEVYEAEDLELRANVALKLVRPELAYEADVLERFKREAQLARSVTHPNVCRIFDLGYHVLAPSGRVPFLTMELLAGETLAERLHRAGRIETTEAMSIVTRMAAGLVAAHQAGVIHRDFKSANVMLLPDGNVKITDFGIARAIDGDGSSRVTLTTDGSALGTPAYMAPEQIEGTDITVATDIYALGVVMYEMVTGNLPFVGDTPWVVAFKRLREAPVSPRIAVPGLDRNWEAAILRCLERDPGSRFASAADVCKALSGEVPAAPMKRNLWALISVAVLAILLVGAYFMVKHRAGQVATSPAANYGWRSTALPADASLSRINFASASSSALSIQLFGPSFVRSWESGQSLSTPLPIAFSVTGQAECNSGLWLIHDDNQHLTEWDAAKQKALITEALPWSFKSAVCLDAKAARWGFLVDQNWIEYDLEAHRAVRTTPLGGDFLKATFDPQQQWLVLIGKSGVSVRSPGGLTEVFSDTLSETLLGHPASAWSESGRYLALGFKQLAIYDLEARKRVHTFPTTGWLSSIGWIGDEGVTAIDDRGRFYFTSDLSRDWQFVQAPKSAGIYQPFWIPFQYRWLAFSSTGESEIWEYTTPSLAFDLPVSPLEVWSIAADPDNSNIAVAGKDWRIQVVDLQQRKVMRALEGHTDGVTYVAFEQSGRLISASDDKTIRVWETAAGKLLKTVTGHQSLVNAFAMSPDKKLLVSVSSDSKIKVWRLPELAFVKDLGTTSGSGAAAAFLLHSSENLAVSDWKGLVYRYQGTPPNWSLQQQFQLNKDGVYMLCPGENAWWAAVPEGDAAGFWRIPADHLAQAVRVSSTPAYYCSTGSDGQLTAALFLNRIELWSNSAGKLTGIYRFAAREAATLAMSSHPPLVIAGFGKGDIMAWPRP